MAAASHFPSHEVHVEIADTQPKRICCAPAPKQGTNSSQQFCERERLDQVIVSARIQTGNAILQCIARGQQQNRRLDASLPNARQNLKSIAAGKHEIQKNQIELLGVDSKKGVFTSVRKIDLVVFFLEAFLERISHFLFIFYDENTHC